VWSYFYTPVYTYGTMHKLLPRLQCEVMQRPCWPSAGMVNFKPRKQGYFLNATDIFISVRILKYKIRELLYMKLNLF